MDPQDIYLLQSKQIGLHQLSEKGAACLKTDVGDSERAYATALHAQSADSPAGAGASLAAGRQRQTL